MAPCKKDGCIILVNSRKYSVACKTQTMHIMHNLHSTHNMQNMHITLTLAKNFKNFDSTL